MFSPAVIEKLEHYVYFLQDPRSDEVFYVGKGIGNRVFHHAQDALEPFEKSAKLDQIRQIYASGHEVRHFILRHGLTEVVAFEIEAAFIDYIGMEDLSNVMGGHYSSDFGLKSPGEIIAMYHGEELDADLPIMLININKHYGREMSQRELYNITRKAWRVGTRREKVKYAVAVYGGLTREVYRVKKWFPVKVKGKIRWGFKAKGGAINLEVLEKLRYKSVRSYFKPGATNPIKYLNC